MIRNHQIIKDFLDKLVGDVFKILPLYEENNVGLEIYIDSILFELNSYEEVVQANHSAEYVSLMLTLTSLKKEVSKSASEKKVIKREVFKCINIIKNMAGKLEQGINRGQVR
ncbi:hypothetical protein AB3N02_22525 [Priestia aryabhattai]|uniref:hypothetical protein n=1 Tax=Priestia aryabhattai TaxID=412384 RepID=UPI0039A0D34E